MTITNARTEQLQGQGGVLGVLPEWTYADAFAPGDGLLPFTDGVIEADDRNRKNSATVASPKPRKPLPVQRLD